MFRKIALAAAVVFAALALTPAAHAGPAPSTALRIAYHVPGHGYHFVASDRSRFDVTRRPVQMRKCHDNACRINVLRFYGRIHRLWTSYNREVWNAAEGLPACTQSSAIQDSCVLDEGDPLISVRVNKVNYFVQASTRP